ncbi:MAG: hypothetical protein FWD23_18270 [Oscillospiraceae bacterium]|nr:hypothetical protein [Oscillospiraceae bacterium]
MLIITGHYGSGKTNIAVNIALNYKKSAPHKKVYLVDLDIVNPYFRTSDNTDMLAENGICVIAPNFANTNLDSPSLPAEINKIFTDRDSYTVIDAGGDDAGAVVLGRYADKFDDSAEMLYVINQRRFMTRTPEEAAELLRGIERVSKLKARGIINNTNLSYETDADCVLRSVPFAEEVSRLTGVPLLYTAVRRELADEISAKCSILPIDLLFL